MTELVTCRQVELRKPVGVNWRFPRSVRQVWAHATFRSRGKARQAVFRWVHRGEARQSLPVHVQRHPRWRTWAFFKFEGQPSGEWVVEVLDPERAGTPDEILARAQFWIEEDAPETAR